MTASLRSPGGLHAPSMAASTAPPHDAIRLLQALRRRAALASRLALALRERLPRPRVLIVRGRKVDDAFYNRMLAAAP